MKQSYRNKIPHGVMIISFASLLFIFPSIVSYGFSQKQVGLSPGITNSSPMVRSAVPGGVTPDYSITFSYNWAGYAVSGITVKKAQGSWIQTAITCNPKASGEQIVVFWVGIDGFASGTVEQTGTLGECAQGSSHPHYFVWYEFYPAQAIIVIKNFNVSVSDKFNATVTSSSTTSFRVTLEDLTTGQVFIAKNPAGFTGSESSAECITEEPSGSSGFFLLAKFATMPWGTDATGIAGSGCSANGKSFGSYGNSGVFELISCRYPDCDKWLAQPTNLSKDGSSFKMVWRNPGP
jgi:hypothetical protein